MNKFFKFILKFLGGFILNFSLTIFILSFFAAYSLDNLDSFQTSLKEIANPNSNINVNETQVNQIEEFCKTNPDVKECTEINKNINNGQGNPTNGFDAYMNRIAAYKANIINLRILSVILFFIGALLIYFANMDLIAALYKVSLSGLLTSLFSIVYLLFLPSIFRGIVNGDYIRSLAKDVPSEMFNRLIDVILNWLKIPLNRTLKIAIILSIAFLILTVLFYILKKKALKKNNIEIKKEGKDKNKGKDTK